MPPRARGRRVRSALPVRAAAFVLLALGRPAAAMTVFQVGGTLSLNYSITTPAPEPGGLVLQFSPAVALHTGSERLVWRVGYAFTGTLNLFGAGETAYSNQLNLGLAAELSDRAAMFVSGGFVQGGAAQVLLQKPAELGQPELRAPGNPAQITATLGETVAWEASERLRFAETVSGTVVAQQDDLSQYNASVSAWLRFDRTLAMDAIGGELFSSVASMRALTAAGERYLTVTNSLVGSWRHDVDVRWSGHLRAGIAQVVTLTGSVPLAIVPTGSLIASYQIGRTAGGSLVLSYGPNTDLQTGTTTQAGSVLLRGFVALEAARPRFLSASAGFLRSRSLGEVPGLAAGVGDAVQGDLGVLWGLSDLFLATARGTLAYQFNQPAGIAPSLVFAVIAGVMFRYGNAAALPPMPTMGQRVDGSDAVPFSSKGAVHEP